MALYTADDLDVLLEQRFFSDLDYSFSTYLAQIFQTSDPVLKFTLALVSKALGNGDICIHIPQIAEKTIPLSVESEDALKFPDSKAWQETLQQSAMVSEKPETPLVMDDDGRVFMARYFDYRQKLIQNITERSLTAPLIDDDGWAQLQASQQITGDDLENDSQIQALIHAVTHSFTVISGGPGTGKTYLTSRITKLLIPAFEKKYKKMPVILLLAPTGKAASRMPNGQTIHVALKPLSDFTGFRHNSKNPVKADMVIIDEASMIDLVLFYQLLDAIPNHAHVVILGDHNQLASVQAGSIFREICSSKKLASQIFMLEKNYRSQGKMGIAQLGKAISMSDADAVERILTDTQYDDIQFESFALPLEKNSIFKQHVINGFKAFYKCDSKQDALAHLEDFKILCAHNQGRFGTLPINHLCENILRNYADSVIKDNGFKLIIMVTANDYRNQLFNGDTGVLLEEKGIRTAVFDSREQSALTLAPDALKGYETAFAISIHKSQGSEYDQVLILMPEKLSPVLSRQLLYTGVTRARRKVIVAGDLELIKQAVKTSVVHTTGLAKALDAFLEDNKKDYE